MLPTSIGGVSRRFAVLAALPSLALAQVQVPLFTFPGSGPGYQQGRAVAVIGDLNFDGIPEYMTGEPFDGFGTPGSTGQGSAILFDGASGIVLQQDYGSFVVPQDHLGIALCGLGDVTGDGLPDFAAGASQGANPLTQPQTNGFVRIYSGGALTAPPALPIAIATISMGSAPAGFNGMGFGSALANVGDVDGDGVNDLAIGAHLATATLPGTTGPGQVFVYSGASLAVAPTLLYTLTGPVTGANFGASVAGIGDIDGDGAGDLVVGAPQDPGSAGNYGDGSIQVYSGATGMSFAVKFEGTPGAFQHVGFSVAGPGDIDLDGFGDILVGAPNVSNPGFPGQQDGQIYVLSGKQAAQGNVGILLSLNGYAGLYPGSGVNADSHLGYSVSAAGDLDSDGVPDLLAGAPGDHFIDPDSDVPPTAWTSLPQAVDSGTCRVYSGANGDLLKVFWGTEPAFAPILAPGNFAGIGAAVAGGDTDGDGKGELIVVGAPGANGGRGRSYVYGPAFTFGNKYGVANPNSFGTTASILASGSLSVAANRLVLTVTGLPAGTTVIPFFGSMPDMAGTPVSNGIRYVGGTIRRLPAVVAGPGPGGTATAVISVDLASLAVGGVIQPHTEWYFQAQYRNAAAGPGVSNMSDAINLGFLP
jgi:hypothetical protein